MLGWGEGAGVVPVEGEAVGGVGVDVGVPPTLGLLLAGVEAPLSPVAPADGV